MQENVLTRPFVLVNQAYPFRAACPSPGCEEILDIMDTWSILDTLSKLRYTNLIKDFVYHENADIQHSDVARRAHEVCKQIHEALILKCQSCYASVDPSADGCSAIQCMSCGFFFCGCCLRSGFDKSDVAVDRAEAHLHAAAHHPSEDPSERNAFLPADIISVGNQNFKMRQVATALRELVGTFENEGHIRSLEHILTIGILCCWTELQDIGIEIPVLWPQIKLQLYSLRLNRTESSLAIPATYPNTTINDVEEKVGGQILSHSLLAGNAEAARQILCSVSTDRFEVNFLDPTHGYPLLSLALLVDDLNSASRLITLGANPLLTNRDGRNALYLAIETGNWRIAKRIFEANPSVSVDEICTTEIHKYTALHVAVRYNNTEAVYGLLKCGANAGLTESEYGYTPLTLATVLRNDCIYALMSDSCTTLYTEHNPDGRTALFVMCEFGLTDMLSALITERPDFDINKSVARTGECVLHVSARYRQPFLVQILLANPCIAHLDLSIQGKTPLVLSMLAKCESSACLILAAGANWDLYEGKPLLHLATELGLIRVLTHMLRVRSFAKQDIESCLTIAVVFAQYDVLDYLLAISMDLCITTALKLACQQDDCWAAQKLLLRENGSALMKAVLEESIVLAVRNGCNGVIRLLVQQFGLDPNSKGRVGESEAVTLLQMARLSKLPRTVAVLIELGAHLGDENNVHHVYSGYYLY